MISVQSFDFDFSVFQFFSCFTSHSPKLSSPPPPPPPSPPTSPSRAPRPAPASRGASLPSSSRGQRQIDQKKEKERVFLRRLLRQKASSLLPAQGSGPKPPKLSPRRKKARRPRRPAAGARKGRQRTRQRARSLSRAACERAPGMRRRRTEREHLLLLPLLLRAFLARHLISSPAPCRRGRWRASTWSRTERAKRASGRERKAFCFCFLLLFQTFRRPRRGKRRRRPSLPL